MGLQGEQRVAVVDGVAGAPYSRLGIPHFSPDGKRVAYVAELPDRSVTIVTDGVQGKPYTAILPTDSVFSPDGSHIAYGAKRDSKTYVVMDGVESKAYEDAGFVVWGKNGARWAYVTALNGLRQVCWTAWSRRCISACRTIRCGSAMTAGTSGMRRNAAMRGG